MSVETSLPPTEQQIQEDRFLFQQRLAFLPRHDQMHVMYAYDNAKYAHAKQVRESGERYFEHPREVAIIGMDELGIRNPQTIAKLLIHDVFEDSALFGNANDGIYEENKREAMFRMGRSFSVEVARDVISVSKPKGTDIKLVSDTEVDQMYHEIVSAGSIDSTRVKACDRLQNLRTLGACSREKQIRKVNETREFYFPLFERLKNPYPQEYEYLMREMNKAIDALNLPS